MDSNSNSNSHKKTKTVGIVTRGVELGGGRSLICVWNSRSPLKEYKFPRWASEYSTVWFNWGEIVWIEPTKSVDEVQDAKNISKLEANNERLRKIEVTYPIGHEALFLIKVLVTFPPTSLDYYQDEFAAAKPLGCRAIGWSVEMGKVAILDEHLEFKPGVCYIGYVARISPDKDWIAEKMGTLWVVDPSKQLKEITDSEPIGRMQQRIPWKASLASPLVGSASSTILSYDGCQTPAPFLPSHSQHFAASMNSSAPPPAHRPLLLSDDWTDDFDGKPRGGASCSMMDNRTSSLPLSVVGAPAQQSQQRMNTEMFLSSPATQSSIKMLMSNHPQMTNDEQRHQQQQQNNQFQETVDISGHNRENIVFGNLIALKLESIHARNANAAIQLQKSIMELCSNFELKVLNSSTYDIDDSSDLGKAFGRIGRE